MSAHKILLVDDSAMARRGGSRQILESAGYVVAEADEGLLALERYFLEKPDLVLLDLVMKGMNGLDVLKKLLEMDERARVIVLSADVQDSSRALAVSAGAADFLNKPVDRVVLLSAVARALENGGIVELTALQQDALVELLNIGFGRAAASLSQLTGHRVLLEVPQVTLQAVDEVGEFLERVVQGPVASVHQIFTGPVAGDALLILDEAGASILKELLTSEPSLPLAIDASAREVITEIGNILLNACLGTFGNLLKVQVSFSVPHLSIEHVGAILESLKVANEGIRYALVVHAGFRLRDTQVTGYMMIVLSVASLDRLIRAVEDWERSQS